MRDNGCAPPSPLTPLTPSPTSTLAPQLPDASPASSFAPPRPRSPPLRGKKARTTGSHQRRAKKRREREEAGEYPKESTRRHVKEAMDNILEFNIDAEELPVNSSGFGGLRRTFAKDRRDADALCAQPGWRRLRYGGKGSIPLVDRKRRLLACVGGMPKDADRWKSEVIEPLEEAIETGSRGVKFSKKEKDHKRGPFPATAIGVSHGGGETVSLQI